jgi:hypothetical protein
MRCENRENMSSGTTAATTEIAQGNFTSNLNSRKSIYGSAQVQVGRATIKRQHLIVNDKVPYILTIPVKSNYQGTEFSTAPTKDLDFELTYQPDYMVMDKHSFILQVPLNETCKKVFI